MCSILDSLDMPVYFFIAEFIPSFVFIKLLYFPPHSSVWIVFIKESIKSAARVHNWEWAFYAVSDHCNENPLANFSFVEPRGH